MFHCKTVASSKQMNVLPFQVTLVPAANKGKIEDQMNNENLEMLQQIFEAADEDGGGGLDVEEFGQAMKMAFGESNSFSSPQKRAC